MEVYPFSTTYQVPTLFQSVQYIFFTLTAIACASPVVARVWQTYKRKCDQERAETYETPCEYRYPIEEAMDHGDIPTYSYVMEYTPSGTVLMRYNTDNEQFEYWGSRSVPYKYLETVARKFVTFFHCSRIYHDWNPYKEEEEDPSTQTTSSTSPKEKEKEKDEPPQEDNEPSVFATFKTYNTTHSNATTTTQKVRNHYVHKGTLHDWYSSQSNMSTSSNKSQGLDFAAYKKLFFSRKE